MRFSVAIVWFASSFLSACNGRADKPDKNDAEMNAGATASVAQAGTLLKCDGVETLRRGTLSGDLKPEVQQTSYGFQIDEANGSLSEWNDQTGKFVLVCDQPRCLQTSPTDYRVIEKFDHKDGSGTRMGLNILTFDRKTGSLETNRLLRVGSGKGEEDLVFYRQTSFAGSCEPVQSTEAFKPKF